MYHKRLKGLIMFLLPLLLVGFLLVACDDDDNDNNNEAGAGGGLDATPAVGLTEDVTNDNSAVEMTDTPEMVEETPVIAPTAAVSVTLEATAVMTDSEVVTDTVDTGEVSGVILASDLIGMDIVNQAGEHIGSVTEALANHSGEIEYVIVEFDELFVDDDDVDDDDDIDDGDTVTETIDTDLPDIGVDIDLAAMSWTDFTFEFDLTDDELLDDDRDFNIVLNGDVDVMTLTMLDDDFLGLLDGDDFVVDEVLDDGEMEVPAEYAGLIQVSAYDDFEIENTAEDDLGDTEDLLINAEDGRIMYAVVDVGGFLGIGESYIAVPWTAVPLDEAMLAEDEEIFRIDIDETFLEEAPTVDLDDWASDVAEDWDQAIRGYWVDFIEEF
jgi:sporulation protein YlmC with PRC-barrel domain